MLMTQFSKSVKQVRYLKGGGFCWGGITEQWVASAWQEGLNEKLGKNTEK